MKFLQKAIEEKHGRELFLPHGQDMSAGGVIWPLPVARFAYSGRRYHGLPSVYGSLLPPKEALFLAGTPHQSPLQDVDNETPQANTLAS